MRILYGVTGEGMGHAIRSSVVLRHLTGEGHDVAVVSSGRAVDFLSARFADVQRIHGFHMVTEENRVRRGRTLSSNVLKGAAGLPGNVEAWFGLVERFEPEVVVSDFESWSYLYGKLHGLPVVSIDNMQVINRCELPDDVLGEGDDRTDFDVTKAFVKGKLPFCDHYLITTFFFPPVRKDRTTLVPPILREEVLSAPARGLVRRGDHLLVYQTAEGHGALERALAGLGMECRIYGARRGIEAEEVEGDLRFRPFSEEGFVRDLATARAVVAGGGFTLMGEAIYLHKPMLAVPLGRQFEQALNARYLEREGYGMAARTADDPEVLRAFLDALPRLEARVATWAQEGNTRVLAALDERLDVAAAGL